MTCYCSKTVNRKVQVVQQTQNKEAEIDKNQRVQIKQKMHEKHIALPFPNEVITMLEGLKNMRNKGQGKTKHETPRS